MAAGTSTRLLLFLLPPFTTLRGRKQGSIRSRHLHLPKRDASTARILLATDGGLEKTHRRWRSDILERDLTSSLEFGTRFDLLISPTDLDTLATFSIQILPQPYRPPSAPHPSRLCSHLLISKCISRLLRALLLCCIVSSFDSDKHMNSSRMSRQSPETEPLCALIDRRPSIQYWFSLALLPLFSSH